MISYGVPYKILTEQDRHDERFFNSLDMKTISSLEGLDSIELYQLGCILESIGTGRGIPKDQQGFGEVSYLKVGNVSKYRIDFEGVELVSEAVVKQNNMQLLQPGDILISRVGTVGNVCIFTDQDPKSTPSDNVLVLRLQNIQNVRPFYVCVFLNSPFGQSQIRRLTKQSLQEVVNQTGIRSIIIPIVNEKSQIEIEDSVNKRLEKIYKLKEQIVSEFDLAGDAVRSSLNLDISSPSETPSLDQLMGTISSLSEQAYNSSKKFYKKINKR
jgi:restriction endonuclease S subunit